MGAITDFWKSERGLFALTLVLGATVLTAMSLMSTDAWIDYTKWIFGIYVGGKSITSAVGLMANKPTPEVEPVKPAAVSKPAEAAV